MPFYQGKTEFGEIYIKEPQNWTTQITRIADQDDILMSVRAPVGPVNLATQKICIGRGLAAIRPTDKIDKLFLFYYLHATEDKIKGGGGSVFDSISKNQIEAISLPLPPLNIQQEIVSEIESYRKIIDGARQVVSNYKPQIKIDPEWPVVELDEICTDILSGGTPSTAVESYWNGNIPWMTSADIVDANTIVVRKNITQDGLKNSTTNLIPKDNIIVVTRVGLGKIAMNKFDVCISQDSQGLILNKEKVFPHFLLYILAEKVLIFKNTSQGTTIQGVTKNQLKTIKIPVPPLAKQREIATQIEKEQQLVDANKQLIQIYEQKIKSKIAEVWET
jgi:restriction endonuclease S subunit